ncbi:MAG: gamma-glutamylcyclotransferase [Actinomycetota bacterium]
MPDEPPVDHRLAAYGSLRPGEQHADVLAGLDGSWEPAVLRGDLVWQDGYPVLSPRADGPRVEAAVLTSADLPAAWPRIDAFEGPAYRRVILDFERSDGTTGAASCYVAL